MDDNKEQEQDLRKRMVVKEKQNLVLVERMRVMSQEHEAIQRMLEWMVNTTVSQMTETRMQVSNLMDDTKHVKDQFDAEQKALNEDWAQKLRLTEAACNSALDQVQKNVQQKLVLTDQYISLKEEEFAVGVQEVELLREKLDIADLEAQAKDEKLMKMMDKLKAMEIHVDKEKDKCKILVSRAVAAQQEAEEKMKEAEEKRECVVLALDVMELSSDYLEIATHSNKSVLEKEVAMLKMKLRSLQTDAALMEEKVEDKLSEMQSIVKKNEEQADAIHSLKVRIKATERESQLYKDELEIQQKTINATRDSYSNKEKQIMLLVEKQDTAAQRLDSKEAEAAAMYIEIESLTKQAEMKEQELQLITHKWETAVAETHQKDQELQVVRKQSDLMEAEMRGRDRQMLELNAKLKNGREETKKQEKIADSLQRQLDALEQQVKLKDDEMEAGKAMIGTLQRGLSMQSDRGEPLTSPGAAAVMRERILIMDSDLKVKAEMITQLKSKEMAIKDQLKIAAKQIAALQNGTEGPAEVRAKSLEERVTSLEGFVSSKDKLMDIKKKELEVAAAKQASLAEELALKEKELELLRLRQVKLDEATEKTQKGYQAARIQCKQLTQVGQSMQQEVKTMKERMASLEEDLEAKNQLIEQLQIKSNVQSLAVYNSSNTGG